jgi:hypothetical protein
MVRRHPEVLRLAGRRGDRKQPLIRPLPLHRCQLPLADPLGVEQDLAGRETLGNQDDSRLPRVDAGKQPFAVECIDRTQEMDLRRLAGGRKSLAQQPGAQQRTADPDVHDVTDRTRFFVARQAAGMQRDSDLPHALCRIVQQGSLGRIEQIVETP